MRLPLRSALLASFLLVSGCVGTDEPTPAADKERGADVAPPAPVEPSSPTVETPAKDSNATASHLNITGTVKLDAAVGIICANTTDVGPCQVGRLVSQAVEISRPAPVKATLTATWTATTPAAETLRFYWRFEGVALTAASESPFTMEIPAEAVPAAGEYRIAVRPDSPGATVDEAVDFILTLEYA